MIWAGKLQFAGERGERDWEELLESLLASLGASLLSANIAKFPPDPLQELSKKN